jgi:hypothetical protein
MRLRSLDHAYTLSASLNDQDGTPVLVLNRTVLLRSDDVLLRRYEVVRATKAERASLEAARFARLLAAGAP